MTNRTLPDPTTSPTVTVEDAARILGISRGLAYTAVREGTIPSIRIGRRYVVKTAALLAMVSADRVRDH
jgi:excisionase family DNA binding protein